MDISLIEFIVYGIIAYTGAVLLIVSAFRETPAGKSQSIVRAMYLSLSIIACIILSGSGVEIQTETTNSTLINVNTTETWTEEVTQTYTLLNPVWIIFHYMLAVVLLVYVILQILLLFTKN